ncbi:MAG: bifunctional UDP-N-acetylglucosamine diphosphorylase/glucosamine-1-phosphate N-acetyltransferase GlmU [Thermomicrobiales bacterium]
MDAANPSQTASVGVAVAVLAAGNGTRFKSSIPKHLHPVAGVPIVERVIRAGLAIEPDRLVAVVSPAMEDLPSMLGMDGLFVTTVQADPQGTASAVRHALDAIGDCEWLVSLLGDNPLLTGDMIRDLVDGARDTGARIGVLTAVTAREKYGRIDRENGNIVRIVEHKNDRPDDPDWHKGIEEINSGIMVLDAPWAREALGRVQRDHETKEFLLTDLIALAVAEHDGTGSWPVQSVTVDEHVAVGVNNRSQQASASSIEFDRKRTSLMEEGVSFIGPESSFIEQSVRIGKDTTILPGCYITGTTVIGTHCVIGPHAVIHNGTIGDDVEVASSTITDSSVETGSSVGPYARLRNGAVLGPDVHIGNFVEVKNSDLGAGTKAGHHAYLGDATVGERVNIGAGVITANYDGVNKHRTEIGDDAFIGSDTVLVAPRTVGTRGRTGAGSVVTHDVAPDTLVVGVPARPRTTGGGSQS